MNALSLASIIFISFSFLVFFASFSRAVRVLAAGAPRNCLHDLGKRIQMLVNQVFLHEKLMRQPVPGLIHFIIFWGFVVLTLGTLEWMYFGVTGGHHFEPLMGERAYAAFSCLEDIFNLLVFLAVAFAFYRRIVIKPKRMADNPKKSKWDAYFILSLIWGLNVTNLLTHAVLIKMGQDPYQFAKPIATALSALVVPSENLYFFFWWAHLSIVLFFLNYLPYSKHFHVILAAPNVFLAKTEARGRLRSLNLEDESILKFGAEKVEDLSWKNLMDSYSCTECGRCNEFCPTATTGKALRPKSVMIDLRAATTERAPLLLKLAGCKGEARDKAIENLSDAEKALYAKDLVPDAISEEAVWDCTTCGACVEACPVMIDHVDALVDMRRALVLNKGQNPEEATNAFRNWESSSNPWGFSESSRQEWLTDRGVPKYDPDQDFEFLYYIGCAGSFDDRNKKVVDSVIRVLQSANVKFGILGREEKCNGETARRLGNEYLGQQMIKANKETLEQYKVKKILTSCPHCFNTLKNEYPEFGGHYEVSHHSEYIEKLIAEGRLQLKVSNEVMTYHDSCYLGRYNEVYEAPREILAALTEKPVVELGRNKQQGFCCGAGGGRMWLEEKTGTRINQNRAEEIAGCGAKTVAVGCPFCMTMISDGLKSKGREDIKVRDLAEIVAEGLD